MLLEEAVTADLTKQEIRTKIQALKARSQLLEKAEEPEKQIRDRIHASYQRLRTNQKVWETPKLQKHLRQMEKLLQSISEAAAQLP
ncbi:MAG: hypothetical protein HC886_09520 [Leptolyngbyaceae cyanobacterium SM1_1_3]|nr:hypothetical protein [Leptolyngbyaceae cyanobacterium SM1_1_3]